jgi:hypothetical protein
MMPAEPVLTRRLFKNKITVQEKKEWEIPRNTKEPAAPIRISTRKVGGLGRRGAHIYRLNAKCHPQKKK